MTESSAIPLQEALFKILNEDSSLSAMISAVVDNPTADIAYPYVALGKFTSADWSTKTTIGQQSTITLHVYSQKSRKEVLAILDRIFELLQVGGLNVQGHNLVVMRFEHNDVNLEADGITYHGVIRYRAFAECEAA